MDVPSPDATFISIFYQLKVNDDTNRVILINSGTKRWRQAPRFVQLTFSTKTPAIAELAAAETVADRPIIKFVFSCIIDASLSPLPRGKSMHITDIVNKTEARNCLLVIFILRIKKEAIAVVMILN